MTVIIILAVLALIVVAVVVYRGVAARAFSETALRELGRVEVPDRLDIRGVNEKPERVLFYFDRVANSFFLIGSNTPYREQLTLLTWPDGTAPDAVDALYRELRVRAAERIDKPEWRQEDGLEIGEGVHEVNNHLGPSWIVLYRLPDEPLMLGYRVWQEDATLDQAKATVRRVAGSFKRVASQSEFFTAVRERPFKEAEAGRAAVAEAMAKRGVTLALDGPPVEAGNTFYNYVIEDVPIEGAWLLILHALGSLPDGPGPYRWKWYDTKPKWIVNIPNVIHFRHDGEGWKRGGLGVEYGVPEALERLLAARHTDPARVYFYAAMGLTVDTTPPESNGIDYFFRCLPEMEAALAAGDLVMRLE